MESLGRRKDIALRKKSSRFAISWCRAGNGSSTVASTMIIAALAGIKAFADRENWCLSWC
ncbi:pseudouridine-5'-phosphate glycosidase [Shigella flexneri]